MIVRLFVLAVFIFGSLGSAGATTFQKYIYEGAAGNGSGSDWSNAFRAIPKPLQRDTVYYVAAGNYEGAVIDTPADGTKQIVLQKATVADHGTNVGWSDALAGGVAKFNGPMQFFTSYVTLDGVTGSGTSGYGFEIYVTNAGYHLVSVPGGFPNQTGITVKHCELHFNSRNASGQAHGFYFPAGVTNLYIGYNYIHDIPGCGILTRYGNNITFENNYVARNRSTPEWHAEGWSDGGSSNVVARYNTWEDIEGTGIIVNLNAGSASSADNWQIYGNVFFLTENHDSGGYGNGIATCINSQRCTNWKFYNNTIANIVEGLNSGVGFEVQGAGNEVKNNLWYCQSGRNCKPANHYNVTAVDYNYYSSSIGHPGEAHAQAGSTNPFVNPAGKNFRLATATAAGASLSAPFNQDMDGRNRGADAVWDRGAYEYPPSGVSVVPPKNLRLVQ